MTTKVAVVGATGKMGQLVSQIVETSTEFELHSQIDSKGELSEMLGADIAVDVTVPAVSQSRTSASKRIGALKPRRGSALE